MVLLKVIYKNINAKIALSILAKENNICMKTLQNYIKSINDNGIEAEFTHLKTKLRVRSGLKLENKIKFISNYFRLKNDERRIKSVELYQHFLPLSQNFKIKYLC